MIVFDFCLRSLRNSISLIFSFPGFDNEAEGRKVVFFAHNTVDSTQGFFIPKFEHRSAIAHLKGIVVCDF